MSSPDPIVYPGMVAFKVEALAIVISGIAYGMAVALFFNCFWLVLSTKSEKRAFLLTYITVMISLGTGAMIQEIFFMMQKILANVSTNTISSIKNLATLEGIPLTLPLIIWGADGLLIWRCNVIYRGASSRARVGLYVVFIVIMLWSLLGDILLYFTNMIGMYLTLGHLRVHDGPGGAVSLIALSTLICNSVLSGLVASRMLSHSRSIRRLTGSGVSNQERDSAYRHVVAMCIESSLMIVAVSAIFLLFAYFIMSVYLAIPLYLLPHICVISPLLIVLRVAQGRAFSYQQEVVRHEVSEIRFSGVASA